MRAPVDGGETDGGDVREEIAVGNVCGGKPGSHGSKAILLSHVYGVVITIASLSPQIHQEHTFRCRSAGKHQLRQAGGPDQQKEYVDPRKTR